MRLHRPSHATVVAYLALFVAMSGTAVAATGGTFLLGRSNAASTTTGLANTAGAALSLTSKAGTAPFAVSSTTKVGRLNADLLDGLDAAALQRRVSGACPDGQQIRAISAAGAVTCTSGGATGAPGPAGGVDGARLYIVGTTLVGDGSNTTGYASAGCRSVGDVLLSGGFHQPFQPQAKVESSSPENYLVVTADHQARWVVQYQYLPKTETLDVYAICQKAG